MIILVRRQDLVPQALNILYKLFFSYTMYQSNYKSLFRCHTLLECVNFSLDSKTDKTDLFLYLLDTYDILLSHADGSMIIDENDDLPYIRLANKMEVYAFEAWDSLFERIPGQLKGWCEGMFLYVCMAMCRWLASRPGCTVIPLDTRIWMKKQRIRTHVSYDTASFTISEVLDALDAIEARWYDMKTLDHHLFIYLDALEFRAAWFISHTSSSKLFDKQKHRLQIINGEYQIHPALIYQLYVRFVSIRRAFAQFTMWDTVPAPEQIPETRWKDFVKTETRHLGIRKFRDNVAKITWDHLLRLSDRPRTSYKARGSKVSSYQSLAENKPMAVLDKLNSLTSYGKPEQMFDHKYIKDGLFLLMVHAHFMSTYSLSFKDYVYCSSEKSWKHRERLKHMVVPIVVERKRRFDVMHRGLVHLVPNGSFEEAFLLWLLIVRRDYKGILYGSMDFGKLCRMMFDPPDVAQHREMSKGMTSYKWDV